MSKRFFLQEQRNDRHDFIREKRETESAKLYNFFSFIVGSNAEDDGMKRKMVTPHKDGLASCLIVKDDNFRLQEWLAYHWMQGMQYLIVAQDAASKTSPKQILETWAGITGMEIILWDDPDYRYEIPQKKSAWTIHNLRQKYFLVECLRHHKAKGRSWTFHIDTDEYITNNVAFGEGQDTIIRQDQNLWQYLTNPDAITPNTVDDERSKVCMHVPRLTFSAREDDENENHDQSLFLSVKGEEVNMKSFDTMRFSYHANPAERAHNFNGKFLLDLERVPLGLINRGDLSSIHRPFTQFCGPSYQYNERLPFMIHHYIGSWEQYGSREDSRRSRELFDAKAYNVYSKTTHIQGWLRDFLLTVGISNGMKLLDIAGQVRRIGSSEKALYELPYYPEPRGSEESYQANEFNLDVVNYFEADGQLARFRKAIDESHFAKDREFNHKTYTGLNEQPNDRDSLCALLFFGLGRSFLYKAFPSIKKYILGQNPGCKVFVHTYNVSDEHEASIDARDLSLLTNDASSILMNSVPDHKRIWRPSLRSILYETEEDFQRQKNVTFYRQFFPTGAVAWNFPTSMDNMIRQWQSISKAWELMESFETNRQLNFDRVGLFRSDVLYTHPIAIGDDSEAAVIPAMMYSPTRWSGLNDRMFYGSREYAEVWATHRFDNIEKYLQHQKSVRTRESKKNRFKGLHSENFMKYLLTVHGHMPLQMKNTCFKRLRSNGQVLHTDCNDFRSSDVNANESMFKSFETDMISRAAPGVIVLGMHRSGTSMLGGVLSNVFSWNVPGRTVTATKYKSQNNKGSFENVDVVRQNDAWMQAQNMSWDKINLFTDENDNGEQIVVGRFDSSLAKKVGMNGQRALKVYNNVTNAPWVLKDPRMCLTLDAWLPLLKSDEHRPPVLFTYRNPLEVALSLRARKRNPVSLYEGLRLWIWYNREAIRLSSGEDICRVITKKRR